MARYSMLIDLTRCIGCDACTVACKQENGTPLDTFFARVLNVEYGSYPKVKRLYIPVLCNHCENPACLKSCPNKAIVQREDGIVLIDQDRCKGTGACVSACPYGNIILSDKDAWYLNDDEPYERDFVKKRLEKGVARKCTYCAHRVDVGLDPACVVACPTTARIFGDLDDPDSAVSAYVRDQKAETGRSPFKLLPEAGTEPAGMYLGPMSRQDVDVVEQDIKPGTGVSESTTFGSVGIAATRHAGNALALFFLVLFLTLFSHANAQDSTRLTIPPQKIDFATSACAGCHGTAAMGGMGPPLAQLKLEQSEFLNTVRHGKSMMPASTEAELSDADAIALFTELKSMPWKPSQIPLAYKVGSVLTGRNLGIIFTLVTLFSFAFGLRVVAYYLGCAGLKQLLPTIARYGRVRALGVFVWSLIVDGFLVASLWRKNKPRWIMHGLILYGFCGLLLGDILMQIFNPTRSQLPLTDPLKLLPVASGVSVIVGLAYVLYRYRKDPYIDNGVTLGRDFLFVNLLANTVVSGFLTIALKRGTAHDWVMPVYLYHLVSVTLLLATAPFTRFNHAFVAPIMAAMTRLTEVLARSGADIGFEREPSPGRHHKSQRIAEQVISLVDPPASDDPVRLRYYP